MAQILTPTNSNVAVTGPDGYSATFEPISIGCIGGCSYDNLLLRNQVKTVIYKNFAYVSTTRDHLGSIIPLSELLIFDGDASYWDSHSWCILRVNITDINMNIEGQHLGLGVHERPNTVYQINGIRKPLETNPEDLDYYTASTFRSACTLDPSTGNYEPNAGIGRRQQPAATTTGYSIFK